MFAQQWESVDVRTRSHLKYMQAAEEEEGRKGKGKKQMVFDCELLNGRPVGSLRLLRADFHLV